MAQTHIEELVYEINLPNIKERGLILRGGGLGYCLLKIMK
jgi:hypothetical protein